MNEQKFYIFLIINVFTYELNIYLIKLNSRIRKVSKKLHSKYKTIENYYINRFMALFPIFKNSFKKKSKIIGKYFFVIILILSIIVSK